MSLFALRRLILRATRDPAYLPVMQDAFFEAFPAQMETEVARAEAFARRRRTGAILYFHPNHFSPRMGYDRRRPILALWPLGQARRRNPTKRYGYVEIYRTRDYRNAEARRA